MVAVQAAGCAPIARAFEAGDEEVSRGKRPLRPLPPPSRTPYEGTLRTVRGRSPWCARAAEEPSLSPRRRRGPRLDLAQSEGLFVEPGAAVASRPTGNSLRRTH